MQTTDMKTAAGSTAGGKNGQSKELRIAARNLIPAVVKAAQQQFGEVGRKLFGISNVFAQNGLGDVVIPNGGNVHAFLQERIERSGLTNLRISTLSEQLGKAIVEIAKQITEQWKAQGDLGPAQLARVALEWVTSACCIPVDAVEPFHTYCVRSQALRQAIKTVDKAQGASNDDAFARGADTGKIKHLLEQARQAWGTIERTLNESLHFATLRMEIDTPLLFSTIGAWEEVRAVSHELRKAVLNELHVMKHEQGTPYISTMAVRQAIARVEGTMSLTGVGNPFGVEVGAYLATMGASRIPGLKPNGGKQVGFDGTPVRYLGANIEGLYGYVTNGKVTSLGEHELRYEFTVTEGSSPTAPLTSPTRVPFHGQRASA